MGYRVIDTIINHMTGVRTKPVVNTINEKELTDTTPIAIRPERTHWDTTLSSVERTVLPNVTHVDHPRNLSSLPSPHNFVSVMGDLLASGMNVNAGSASGAPAVTLLEHEIIDWLRQMCGLPESAGGSLVASSSVAHITALTAAINSRLGSDRSDAIFYTTAQTHTATLKALTVLGIAKEHIRMVQTDEQYRMDVNQLRECISEDIVASKEPFCVIATAGTTDTGAIDSLDEIARICKRERLWFHIDGSYGAMATLTTQGKTLLSGIEQADSLVLDPHTWLFQPYDIGCVLVRNADVLNTQTPSNENGVPLSKRARALPLWMSLQTFGTDHIKRAIEYGMALATCAQERLEHLPRWTIVSPAQLAILAFRYEDDRWSPEKTDQMNTRILQRVRAANFVGIHSTQLDGRLTFGMCTINPRTTVGDIDDVIIHLDTIAQEVIASEQS